MAKSHCDLSEGNILSGTRRRLRSKSESEFEDPPVTRDRTGSLSRMKSPAGLLSTPGQEKDFQPSDMFMETPLGLGSSTRLDEGLIQPDWETIDCNLNYMEAMAKKFGTAPTAEVKANYNSMFATLSQIERSLQINQQYKDLPDVDQRKNRLYRTKEYRIKACSVWRLCSTGS